MSGPLPSLTSSQVLAGLRRLGFVLSRQSGSHVVLKHLMGAGLQYPNTGGDMSKGTLRRILRETNVTVEELLGR